MVFTLNIMVNSERCYARDAERCVEKKYLEMRTNYGVRVIKCTPDEVLHARSNGGIHEVTPQSFFVSLSCYRVIVMPGEESKN